MNSCVFMARLGGRVELSVDGVFQNSIYIYVP